MDIKWVAEEVRLWDAMHAKPETSDRNKNAKAAERAKRAGKTPRKLPTEEEVVARSWRAYQQWIGHLPQV